MNTSCFFDKRWLHAAAAALALVSASGVQAAITYTYTGRMLYTPENYPPYNGDATGRMTATATFDETIVTSTFSGTLYQDSFSGSLGGNIMFGSPSGPVSFNKGAPGALDEFPFDLWPAYFFTFLNGQVVDWFVGGAWNDMSDGGHFISRSTEDLARRYRSNPFPSSYSLAGEQGTWTRESELSPVPLPLTLPLLAAGLAGLGVVGRRKKAA